MSGGRYDRNRRHLCLGRDRESDQPILEEDRNREGDVGAMRRTAIGIVVHDDIAGQDLLAPRLQRLPDTADVARDRARLERRRELALAELLPISIGESRTEILRFPDD